MNRITSLTKQYPIAAFFILTFILSWGVGLLTDAVWEATQSVPLTLPFLILSFAPLSAVLIVSAVIGGKGAILVLLHKFTIWRVGWRWYMVALFLLPALTLVTIYLNVLLGAPAPSITSFGSWSSLLGAFALRLVFPGDGPMLEELGWRGFAQPRLQKLYTPLTANLFLAFLVTLWHLQYIPTGDYAWVYMPATIASTILYGWVYISQLVNETIYADPGYLCKSFHVRDSNFTIAKIDVFVNSKRLECEPNLKSEPKNFNNK